MALKKSGPQPWPAGLRRRRCCDGYLPREPAAMNIVVGDDRYRGRRLGDTLPAARNAGDLLAEAMKIKGWCTYCAAKWISFPRNLSLCNNCLCPENYDDLQDIINWHETGILGPTPLTAGEIEELKGLTYES